MIVLFNCSKSAGSREKCVSGIITESLSIGGIGSSSLVPKVEVTLSSQVLPDEMNEDIVLLL